MGLYTFPHGLYILIIFHDLPKIPLHIKYEQKLEQHATTYTASKCSRMPLLESNSRYFSSSSLLPYQLVPTNRANVTCLSYNSSAIPPNPSSDIVTTAPTRGAGARLYLFKHKRGSDIAPCRPTPACPLTNKTQKMLFQAFPLQL